VLSLLNVPLVDLQGNDALIRVYDDAGNDPPLSETRVAAY